MRRLRIVHVVPRGERPTSGVFNALVRLAAALSRRGHEVHVWSPTTWVGAGYAGAIAELDDAGVRRAWAATHTGLPGAARSLARRAADAADVVHLHGAFNRTNTMLSWWLSIPYVFSPHGGYDAVSLERSRRRKRAYVAAFERPMLRKAAVIVALTAQEERDVRALGVGATPVIVVPNGGPGSVQPADRSAFRRDLGIDGTVPLALFVGRLDVDRKGLDRALHGVAASPRWRVALVGPQERGDLPRLHALIRDLGVRERAYVCGPLHGDALEQAFAAADVFLLLSRWEGLPLALLEALGRGTPAVVSEEVERVVPVAASGAGWVASSSASLAATLDAIASSGEATRRHRSARARELGRAYDWDEIARTYEATYEAAADRASVVGWDAQDS